MSGYSSARYDDDKCNGCGDIMKKRVWDEECSAWTYVCLNCEPKYRNKEGNANK